MPDITIPTPGVPIAVAKCTQCDATYHVMIDPTWYRKLTEWLRQTNNSSTDVTANAAEIQAIKTYLGI